MDGISILEALGASAHSMVEPAPSDAYKAAMRRFAGGVTVVTARSPQGEPVGMTATAVCSLSADPPALLVCANRSGSFASQISMAAPFSVHVLGADQLEVARICAGMSGKQGADRFAGPHWALNEAGVPVLPEALARFDCVATSLFPNAPHLLAIGHVGAVHLGSPTGAALVYIGGAFVSVAGN